MEPVPQLPVPVVPAACLHRLLAYYRDVLRFRVLQEVSGVVAFVQRGALCLQLWQRETGPGRRPCAVELAPEADIFALYASLACSARSALVEDRPQLMPWAAWEFTLFDCEGNQLRFLQWT